MCDACRVRAPYPDPPPSTDQPDAYFDALDNVALAAGWTRTCPERGHLICPACTAIQLIPALLDQARDLLENLPAHPVGPVAPVAWVWEHVEGTDTGTVEAADGGAIAFVPPFTCIHTVIRHGTQYSHPVARFIAASPVLVRRLCTQIEALQAVLAAHTKQTAHVAAVEAAKSRWAARVPSEAEYMRALLDGGGVADETIAALGEGRLLPAEEQVARTHMTNAQCAALRDLYPDAYQRLFPHNEDSNA